MLGWASSLFSGGADSSAAKKTIGGHTEPNVLSASGTLQRYDPQTGQFTNMIEGAKVALQRADPRQEFTYSFIVFDSDGAIQVTQTLDHGMQIQFNKAMHSMIWALPLGDELDDDMVSLGFVFADQAEEDAFKLQVATSLYESSRQESFSKTVKAVDSEWVLNANADVDYNAPIDDPMEFDSSAESDAEVDEPASPPLSSNRGRVMVTPPRRTNRDESAADEKNSHLAVGMGLDRSYVVRGSDIGVFKHGRDGMDHLATIDRVRTADGSVFSPSKVMLHDRDRKMLMLRPDRENSVIELDLETQQVVQEYNADDDTKIRELGPHSRFSQMEGTELITGLNKTSLFAMDPRLHGKNKKVSDFSYKVNPQLSCIAATGNAQYALGSDKGEIRMFSDIGKRAKTLLPGLGHAITGIDTSQDGQWVLATTDRYILLIPTQLDDGRTGFDVSMGKSKPVPIKLQLSPQDMVKYRIRDVCFRKATFDMGVGQKEQWIVSATGNLLVTWNLKSVQRGKLNDYTIKEYAENVVADQFRYGHSDVVIALPDDVKRARFRTKKANR